VEPVQAVILGVIQGLTEFLPVSSSGHLVLFQRLLGLEEPELLFDVAVHTGTLAAVFAVFHRPIAQAAAGFFRLLAQALSPGKSVEWDADSRLAAVIILGSVPTAILGLSVQRFLLWSFASVPFASSMLLLTGVILWLTRGHGFSGRTEAGLTAKDGLVVGIAQGLAVMPGISRSGATIATGIFMGIDRPAAARLSFLMSIPAILGALVLEGSGADPAVLAGEWPVLLLGGAVAAATGYAALRLLLRLLQHGKFHLFAIYCWMAAAAGFTAHFLGA